MANWTDKELLFAEGFHTAFRKGLDSVASVIIWNAIHFLDKETWHLFCSEIVGGEGTLEQKCKNAEALRRGEPARNLMRTGFEMMSSEEFDSIEKYWINLTHEEVT